MAGDDLDFTMFSPFFSLSLFCSEPLAPQSGVGAFDWLLFIAFQVLPDCFEPEAVLTENVPCKSNTVVFKF